MLHNVNILQTQLVHDSKALRSYRIMIILLSKPRLHILHHLLTFWGAFRETTVAKHREMKVQEQKEENVKKM